MTASASASAITVVILTHDEEIHIARCIERARPFAARIVVVDSGSSDRTAAIARAAGADVLERPFTFHAEQFEWGVAGAEIDTGWIMRLDADEYLEPALIEAIVRRLPNLPETITAVEMPLLVKFQGQPIRWGGYADTVLTRLWRTGAGHFEQRWMDERLLLSHGDTVRFDMGCLIDDNLKDIAFWTAKHNRYSTRHMAQYIDLEYGLFEGGSRDMAGLNRQGRKKRYLRDNVYARAPLYLRAVLYFLFRYFVRLGVLDGRKGFIWHVLQGFWHMLLIDVKVGEARRFIATRGLPAFREHLAATHGITTGPPGGSAVRADQTAEVDP